MIQYIHFFVLVASLHQMQLVLYIGCSVAFSVSCLFVCLVLNDASTLVGY